MSIVLGGARYEIPGVESFSWLDDPRAVRTRHFTNARTRRVQMIVLHTTSGRPTGVKAGLGRPTDRFRFARDSARTVTTPQRGASSWDATVNLDGTVTWQNDPLERFTWHATSVNPISIGIEIAQNDEGYVYAGQLAVAAALVHFLTEKLQIQRQIPWYNGAPDRRALSRIADGGDDFVGVLGHFNVTTDKSDPGGQIFELLHAAGYEGFDLASGEDKRVWAARQTALGVTADGEPGPATIAALTARGHAGGLWVATQGSGGAIGWIALATLAAVALYLSTRKP